MISPTSQLKTMKTKWITNDSSHTKTLSPLKCWHAHMFHTTCSFCPAGSGCSGMGTEPSEGSEGKVIPRWGQNSGIPQCVLALMPQDSLLLPSLSFSLHPGSRVGSHSIHCHIHAFWSQTHCSGRLWNLSKTKITHHDFSCSWRMEYFMAIAKLLVVILKLWLPRGRHNWPTCFQFI